MISLWLESGTEHISSLFEHTFKLKTFTGSLINDEWSPSSRRAGAIKNEGLMRKSLARCMIFEYKFVMECL